MKAKTLNVAALVYLAAPLFIFIIGYLKWYVALAAGALSLYAVWQAARQLAACEKTDDTMPCQWMAVVTALAATFLIGVGGCFSQSADWIAKNPMLNDLSLSPWPVIVSPQGFSAEMQRICGTEPMGLVYYFFFYLPAACVGKVAGIAAARFALFVWTACGLYILINQVWRFAAGGGISWRKALLLTSFFIFFGGFDIVGSLIKAAVELAKGAPSALVRPYELDTWCTPYFTYYASHWTSLWWCFNQCIPVWMITALVVRSRNVGIIGFLYSFTIIYSPWATMGMLPIAAGYAVCRVAGDRREWKRLFGVANVAFPLMLLLLVGSFYMSNNHPLADKGWFWEFVTPFKFFVKYAVFIIIEIGIYAFLLRKRMRSDSLLVLSFITLLLVPFYRMTYFNDFIMRASLPALFVVFLYWARWGEENFLRRRRLVLAVVCLSGMTALYREAREFWVLYKFREIRLAWPDERFTRPGNVEVVGLGEIQFFAHDYQKTFFWKYLAK